MTHTDANDGLGKTGGEQDSAPFLLERHSLPVLAQMAGLKDALPLARLLAMPRYNARLVRFFQHVDRRPAQTIRPERADAGGLSAAERDTLFEGLGLCWGLARLRAALTPDEMAFLKNTFAPDVLRFANDALGDLRVAPALSAPSGIAWLTPDSCRAFGQAVFLGWIDAHQPESLGAVCEGLGLQTTGNDVHRITALDDLIAAFMRQQDGRS